MFWHGDGAIVGDGACLFRSVSCAIGEFQNLSIFYRQQALESISTLVFLGATGSGDQASLDRMKNGMAHFHADQIRKFVCLVCNWARRPHAIRQVTVFIQKLRERSGLLFLTKSSPLSLLTT
jgi:hypothetical protein